MRYTNIGYALLVAAAACAPEPSQDRPTAEWSIDPDPLLTITGETDPSGPLHSVSGAVQLETGILVADRGSSELRLYAANGAFLHALGREGEGPGEFRSLRIVGRLPADTVVVFDGRNRRLSLVCDGTRLCVERPLPQASNVLGIIRDHIAFESVLAGQSLGTSADRHIYMMATRQGMAVDTALELEGRPRLVGYTGGRITSVPVPLTTTPWAVATATNVLVSDGRSPVLHVLQPPGAEVGSIPLPISLRPLDRQEFRRVIERAAENWPNRERDELRSLLQSASPPASLPPVYGLLVDRVGMLWVRLFAEEEGGIEWLVTDGDGSPVARVRTPDRFEVTEIGADYVMGIGRDSLDVESVRVHALNRR